MLPAGKYRLSQVPADYINIRAKPNPASGFSNASADLGDLYPGAFVTLTGAASGDWLELETADGVRGWVSTQGGKVVFEAVDIKPLPSLNGIDISQAQTPLDWNAVKAGGVSFVIIRATQGTATSRPVGADVRFRAHIEGAFAAGLDVGVYHNYLPDVEGGKQAEFYNGVIAPYLDRLAFPPAVDVETVNGQSRAVITGRLFDLVHTLQALHIDTPMIYTSPGFWHEHTEPRNDDYFGRLPLWVAHWDVSKPTLPRAWKGKDWTLWQWKVKRDGIPGYPKAIDLDRRKA